MKKTDGPPTYLDETGAVAHVCRGDRSSDFGRELMELIVLFSPISDAAAFVAADGIGWEQPTVRLDHRPYDKWLC